MKAIPASDYVITPFTTYKSWTCEYNYTNEASRSAAPSMSVLVGEAIDARDRFFNFPSNWEQNFDGSYVKLVHSSVKQLFYNSSSRANNVGNTSEIAFPPTDNVYVISVGNKVIGEGIKPGTLHIVDRNYLIDGQPLEFYDDGDGNVYERTTGDIVGNIFYSQGLIVFNSVSSITCLAPFTLEWNGADWKTVTSGTQDIIFNGTYLFEVTSSNGAQYSGQFAWNTASLQFSNQSEIYLHTTNNTPLTLFARTFNSASSVMELQLKVSGTVPPLPVSGSETYQLCFTRMA